MATVEIAPVLPPEAIVPDITSSSEYILNRQKGEFIPPLQSYSYQGNSQLVFDINSPTSFCDFSNSYLRFYLSVSGAIQQVNVAGGSASQTGSRYDVRQYLAEGGAQALFRNVTVSTLNGTELARLALGNRLNAMFRNTTKSKEYIDRCLWREGDSFEAVAEQQRTCIYNWSTCPTAAAVYGTADPDRQVLYDWGLITPAVVVNVAGQGAFMTLTFANVTAGLGFAYRDIQVGDEIFIACGTEATTILSVGYMLTVIKLNSTIAGAAVAGVLLCRIMSYGPSSVSVSGSITDNVTAFTVWRYKAITPVRNLICALTNGSIADRYKLATNTHATPLGAPCTFPFLAPAPNVGGTAPTGGTTFPDYYAFSPAMGGYEICMQPFHPILLSQIWWPLFLIRGGIRITFDLEKPDFALVTGSSGVPYAWNYVIRNPQYVCDMIQPTQTLTNIYVDLYNNNRLNYHVVGFLQQTDSQTAGSQGNFATRLFPSVRSAVHYICAIQDARHINAIATGSGTGTVACDPGQDGMYVDSLAAGLWSYLNYFQIDIGTERFPLNRPVILDDNGAAFSANSLSEMLVALEYALNTLGVANLGKNVEHDMFSPLRPRNQYLWSYMQKGISSLVASPAAGVPLIGGAVNAQRFYICISLARHASPFCGINVKDNAVQPNFNFNAAALVYPWGTNSIEVPVGVAVTRYFQQFISYDSTISIGRDGLIQRR